MTDILYIKPITIWWYNDICPAFLQYFMTDIIPFGYWLDAFVKSSIHDTFGFHFFFHFASCVHTLQQHILNSYSTFKKEKYAIYVDNIPWNFIIFSLFFLIITSSSSCCRRISRISP